MFNKNNLRKLLFERKITICQLSVFTGIPKSSLTRLYNGKIKNPGFETVEILADYFKINMETFVSRGANY